MLIIRPRQKAFDPSIIRSISTTSFYYYSTTTISLIIIYLFFPSSHSFFLFFFFIKIYFLYQKQNRFGVFPLLLVVMRLVVCLLFPIDNRLSMYYLLFKKLIFYYQ